jgi:hypothetical protein
MGLRQKIKVMLHQISWFTYGVSILSMVAIYYLYVLATFYRTEFYSIILKLSGKRVVAPPLSGGDLQIPDYNIMGKAQPEAIDFVTQEELSFAPVAEVEEFTREPAGSQELNSRLIGYFSEMVSEVKTLIRVINESSESKENFEMLFKLVAQKYPELAGTEYQGQINRYLLIEGAPEFPFTLTADELDEYWTTEK